MEPSRIWSLISAALITMGIVILFSKGLWLAALI
jgi:hypothetical protein